MDDPQCGSPDGQPHIPHPLSYLNTHTFAHGKKEQIVYVVTSSWQYGNTKIEQYQYNET